jgi:hypothetical protein
MQLFTSYKSFSMIVTEGRSLVFTKTPCYQCQSGRILNSLVHELLPLVRDFNRLLSVTQRHIRHALFCTDGTSFCFVFHKCDSLSSWHQPYFSESLKATKQCTETINFVVVRYVLHKQCLIRRQILVWNDCCSATCRLKSRTSRLNRPCCSGLWYTCSWSL